MVHFDDSSSDKRRALLVPRSGVPALVQPRVPGRRHPDPDHAVDPPRGLSRGRLPPRAGRAGADAGRNGTPFRYGGANTAYFGLAITAAAHEHITLEQLDALTTDIAIVARAAGWSPEDVDIASSATTRGRSSTRATTRRSRTSGGSSAGRSTRPASTPTDPVIDLGQLREGVRTSCTTPRRRSGAGGPERRALAPPTPLVALSPRRGAAGRPRRRVAPLAPRPRCADPRRA
jgi:hypothetical protein